MEANGVKTVPSACEQFRAAWNRTVELAGKNLAQKLTELTEKSPTRKKRKRSAYVNYIAAWASMDQAAKDQYNPENPEKSRKKIYKSSRGQKGICTRAFRKIW